MRSKKKSWKERSSIPRLPVRGRRSGRYTPVYQMSDKQRRAMFARLNQREQVEADAVADRVTTSPDSMRLEGTGRQQNNRRSYPPTTQVDDTLQYRPETMRIMKKWRDEIKPYRPREYSPDAVQKKLKKFTKLSDTLANIYGIRPPKIRVGTMNAQTWNQPMSSGSSNYSPGTHTITINGKFSVVTFLHEFGHARGFDEPDAVTWSVNLFKRIYPRSFARLHAHGHTLQTGR